MEIKIIVTLIYFITAFLFIKTIKDTDYYTKYATYMQNECDGSVFERDTMRSIMYNKLKLGSNNYNFKINAVLISISLFYVYLLITIFIGEFAAEQSIFPDEIININIKIKDYLKQNIFKIVIILIFTIIIAIKIFGTSNIIDFSKYTTNYNNVQSALKNTLFRINIRTENDLDDSKPQKKYIRKILQRIARVQNFDSIDAALSFYNNAIQSGTTNQIIDYIDFKNDKVDLMYAIDAACSDDNKLFENISKINNTALKNTVIPEILNRIISNEYLAANDTSSAKAIYNAAISTENYDYIIDLIQFPDANGTGGDGQYFSRESTANDTFNKLTYINNFADYNYGNILYDSNFSNYYIGREYNLNNSKFENTLLSMKIFCVFIVFTLIILIRDLFINMELTSFILIFLSLFILIIGVFYSANATMYS